MFALLDQFLSPIPEGIHFVLWLTLATWIFSYQLERRKHALPIALIGAILFGLCGYLWERAAGSLGIGWYLTAPMLNVLIVLGCCRVSWQEAMLCSIYASLTEHLSNSLFILIFITQFNLKLAYTTISILVYACVWFLCRGVAHNGHYYVSTGSVIFSRALTSFVLVVLSYECKQTADPGLSLQIADETVRTMLQWSQLYAIAFCAVMLLTEYGYQRQMQMRMDLAASHELLRIKEQQYQMTRDNIELINRKCHDMKHQVAMLMRQERDGQKSARNFGREILRAIEVYDRNIDTGNEVLNTILRDRSLYCSMNDISWTCSAHGEALGFVDPLDLAALIGNALDNAVEAVEHIPNKAEQIISIQIAPKNNMVQILVENSFDGTLEQAGSEILTRKADKGAHGFGLRSIRSVSEKYGGCAVTKAEGNTFILNILIPIPEQ